MAGIIKIIEENEKLTFSYLRKINLWSFIGALFLPLFFIMIMGDMKNFGIFWLCLSLALGATFSIPIILQNREIRLTIDEKFITIEYPSSNGEEVIKKVFVNENIKSISIENRHHRYEFWIEDDKGEKMPLLGKKEGFKAKQTDDVYQKLDKVIHFFDKKTYLNPKKVDIHQISTSKKEVLKKTPPRQITKEQDTAKLKIQDLRKGVLFDFQNEHWEVIHQIQYDWKLENTDTLYQIKNQRNQTLLLFVVQDMAIYTAWITERVPQYELINSRLDKVSQNLPIQFTFRESMFLKEHFNTGYEFVSKSKNGVKIKQWKYLSEDRKESLRILEHEDKDTFVFWGEKIEEFEFSNILSS